MLALQLFFAKGESIGKSSLTTPIALPPRIEIDKIKHPNALWAKARNASSSSEAADNLKDLAIGYDLATEMFESIHLIAAEPKIHKIKNNTQTLPTYVTASIFTIWK